MKIVHSTLSEACSSNAFLADRLSRAARIVFELYLDVLTVHHRQDRRMDSR
jgi:hypothetical protein